MGTFPETWVSPYIEQLKSAYSQYPSLAARPFEDEFKIVGIRYDDVFEDMRAQWADSATKVLNVFTQAGLANSAAGKLLKLNQGLGKNQFVNTHILDVLQYRFLPTIAEEIRNRVMDKIQEQVLDVSPPPYYSIIAHSLGTVVVAEGLHKWMTARTWRDTKLDSRFAPTNLFMVANCSRVLWNLDGNVYDSAVTPYPTRAEGACDYYGNYSHPLDPVTQIQPFDEPPDRWFPAGVRREEIYGNVDLHPEDTSQLDVHALEHYLAHPRVHVNIFEGLRQVYELVTSDEVATAISKYNQTTLAGKALADVRQQLAAFTGGTTQSLQAAVPNWLAYLLAVLKR
jgi:hypothetical protein